MLAIYILPKPLMLVKKGFRDMFLLAPEEDIMTIIKLHAEIALDHDDFEDRIIDVVRTGRKLWVSVYFKPHKETIDLSTIAKYQEKLLERLQKEYGEVDVELIPDI